MSDLHAVKARIRALKAKTVANGCTEAEAMLAAEKVMALMRQYGLADGQDECAREDVSLGRSRRSPLDGLFRAVGHVCHCQTFMVKGGEKLAMAYYGRAPWPDVAEYLHLVVLGAANRAMKEFTASDSYKRRRTSRTRAAARKHFAEGFVLGLSMKLLEMKDAAGDRVQQDADLMLAQKAMAADGIVLRIHRPISQAKGGRRYDDARDGGYGAGRRTQVSWGMDGARDQPQAITDAGS